MAKRINSREKGARAERDLKKKLSSWWGCEFSRTPGSGSWATRGYNVPGLVLEGDLTTVDNDWRFSVEAKNVEGWHLEQLLTAPKSDIWSFWDQTLRETGEDRVPLLFFKRNRHPWLFSMRRKDFLLELPSTCVIVRSPSREEFVIGLADDLWDTTKEAWVKSWQSINNVSVNENCQKEGG